MEKSVLLVLILFFSQTVFGQIKTSFESEGMKIEVNSLLSKVGVIWSMTPLSNDEILLTIRTGELKKFNLKTKALEDIKGVPKVWAEGQGGLLDIKLHPKFSENSLVYFTYSKAHEKRGASTTLAKAKLSGNELQNVEDLITVKAVSTGVHFGSRLIFDSTDSIYLTVGDHGEREKAQDLKAHNGKVLRLTEDGKPHPENPFLNDSTKLPEIFSYGHRNPQGIAIHPDTNQVWVNEHGPRGGDEINILKKGADFGWPVITHGKEYWGPKIGDGVEKEGVEKAIKTFIPSIAPSSLVIYSGKHFKAWKNNALSGALVLTHLNRIVFDQNNKEIKEERFLEKLEQRIRNVLEMPDGKLLLGTDKGELLELK
jgi:glucose/arabinose dehydrogenase